MHVLLSACTHTHTQNITTVNLPFMGMAGQHLDGVDYELSNCTQKCLFVHRSIKVCTPCVPRFPCPSLCS